MTTALTRAMAPEVGPPGGAVAGLADSPLPVFTSALMVQALKAYRELQAALDASMPDQIMQLDGRAFRKKGYWRAVAVAFNLRLDVVEERREASGAFEDGRENFGYTVVYRATAPNGRHATGDGACFAVEKARRFRCPHPHPSWPGKTLHFPATSCPAFDAAFQWRTLPSEASEHNVRSHAHTRAFNRAVSNLVGFGEVSAEEIERDRDRGEALASPEDQAPRPKTTTPAASDVPAGALETARVVVREVRQKPTSTGGTKFMVLADDGETYSTFKRDVAELARTAKDTGAEIEIVYKASRYGRDVVTLRDTSGPEPVL